MISSILPHKTDPARSDRIFRQFVEACQQSGRINLFWKATATRDKQPIVLPDVECLPIQPRPTIKAPVKRGLPVDETPKEEPPAKRALVETQPQRLSRIQLMAPHSSQTSESDDDRLMAASYIDHFLDRPDPCPFSSFKKAITRRVDGCVPMDLVEQIASSYTSLHTDGEPIYIQSRHDMLVLNRLIHEDKLCGLIDLRFNIHAIRKHDEMDLFEHLPSKCRIQIPPSSLVDIATMALSESDASLEIHTVVHDETKSAALLREWMESLPKLPRILGRIFIHFPHLSLDAKLDWPEILRLVGAKSVTCWNWSAATHLALLRTAQSITIHCDECETAKQLGHAWVAKRDFLESVTEALRSVTIHLKSYKCMDMLRMTVNNSISFVKTTEASPTRLG